MSGPRSVKVQVTVQTENGDHELMTLIHDFSTGASTLALHTTSRDPKGQGALRAAENALGNALKDVIQAKGEEGITRAFVKREDWNGKFDA